jgi:hypothetical protein
MRHVLLSSVLLVACAPAVQPDDPDGGRPDAAADPDGPSGPDAEVPDYSNVYAHSGTVLYRLDTTTLQPVMVGAFTNLGTQSITDIAIDKNDTMVGITLDRIFSIDEATGAATLLTELAPGSPNLTSLSFVPTDLTNSNSDEILVAAASDGTVYEINPDTGATTNLGSYGMTEGDEAIKSSGDIVAVHGLGIYATVTLGDSFTAPDYLAVIDPETWTATPLSVQTAYDKIFGIAFWRDTIYGFVDLGDGEGGAIVSFDPYTGAATPVNTGAVRWYGAGVTTDAPVVD